MDITAHGIYQYYRRIYAAGRNVYCSITHGEHYVFPRCKYVVSTMPCCCKYIRWNYYRRSLHRRYCHIPHLRYPNVTALVVMSVYEQHGPCGVHMRHRCLMRTIHV